eukprot:jgi/Tetstr1/426950/TSEL_017163.t1
MGNPKLLLASLLWGLVGWGLGGCGAAGDDRRAGRQLRQSWFNPDSLLPTNITWVHNDLGPSSCTAAVFNFTVPLTEYKLFIHPRVKMDNTCSMSSLRISPVYSACDHTIPTNCTASSAEWATAGEALERVLNGEPVESGSIPGCEVAYVLVSSTCQDQSYLRLTMESASDAAQDAPSVAGVPVTGMHLLNYTITLQPNDCLSELLYFPDDAMYYVGRVHNTTALPSACGLDSFHVSDVINSNDCSAMGWANCTEAYSPVMNNTQLCDTVFSVHPRLSLDNVADELGIDSDTNTRYSDYACLDLDVGLVFFESMCPEKVSLSFELILMQLENCDTFASRVASGLLSAYALTVFILLGLLFGSCCACFCCPLCPFAANRRKLVAARARIQQFAKSSLGIPDLLKRHAL